jgi:hypothetical protein
MQKRATGRFEVVLAVLVFYARFGTSNSIEGSLGECGIKKPN